MDDRGCGINADDNYEHPMQNVMYVAGNIPGKGVDVDEFEAQFSVGCVCEDNCLQDCSCVRQCVNYFDNKINELNTSKLILECNPSCSCRIRCGNRLVQLGPLDCLQIVDSNSKGFGLSTRKKIYKSQFICEYAGEVVGFEEAKLRIEANKVESQMNYVLIVSEFIGDKKTVTCIDPKYLGNIGRYCNHSCNPNAKLVPIRVENLIPRLCLFATRNIDVGDEITFDYGDSSNGFHAINEKSADNISNTPCLCKANNCVGFLPHNSI